MAKLQLEVLYEDNHIIAVNKSCGEIVQGDKTGDEPLSDRIKQYIKAKYKKEGDVFIGVPHRLDRPVSGVMIFARTTKALTRLNLMFQKQDQEIKKTYWALTKVCPRLEEERLTHYLIKNEKNNRTHAHMTERTGSKKAILDYKLISSSQKYYLIEVNLLTGRHHQIRAQLAKIGSPIRGDLKYGYSRSNKLGGISLHARSIEFIHPVKKEMIKIVAPTPKGDNLWKEFVKLVNGTT